MECTYTYNRQLSHSLLLCTERFTRATSTTTSGRVSNNALSRTYTMAPAQQQTTMQPDAMTILCTVLTLYGCYAMFFSSKPVNLGGVVLLVVLALSTTQAIMGFSKSWSRTEVVGENPEDVVDLMKSMLRQVTTRGYSWMS